MEKIFSLLLLTFISVTVFSQTNPSIYLQQKRTEASPVSIERFQHIQITGKVNVHILQSDSNTVAIAKDRKETVQFWVEDGMLKITDNYQGSSNLAKKEKTDIYITTSNIRTIEINDGSNLYFLEHFKLENLELVAKNSSYIEGLITVTHQLSLNISGKSILKLSGATENLKVNASGAAKIYAYKLQSETSTILTSGFAKAYINTQKTISINAGGISVVAYLGEAHIESKVKGILSHIRREHNYSNEITYMRKFNSFFR